MSERIAADPTPIGLMHVVGVDHYGAAFSFVLDPLVLTRACDQMSAAADRMLARRLYRESDES